MHEEIIHGVGKYSQPPINVEQSQNLTRDSPADRYDYIAFVQEDDIIHGLSRHYPVSRCRSGGRVPVTPVG